MEFTQAQLKSIDEGNALKDLKHSPGWAVVTQRIEAAIAGIERQLMNLPLEDAEGAALSPEAIGLEYIRQRRLKSGIEAIPAEVDNTIRRAEKLQDDTPPPTTRP